MFRAIAHILLIALLTILTQLGGLAWLVALMFQRRLLAFVLAYAALSFSALWIAPQFGRVALPCFGEGPLQVQTPLFCALNRHYVTPELRDVLTDYAADMARDFPNTETRVLDANFPFLSGFPLLPHLSHADGRKVDLAFYYEDDSGYLAGKARSPIGYFAFEDGPTNCPKELLSLRWDMGWIQGLWPAYGLNAQRMTAALEKLSAEPRLSKIFIEPHLKNALGVNSSKLRFQGCRAARHDDHIHIQL